MVYARFGRDKDERNGLAGILLHQDTETIGSRDCDRGSVRVFEAQLASQPHGDWLSGTRTAQKAVGDFIIEVARKSGLYISESSFASFGERKRIPSGESVIYENASQGVVYKVRDPFAKFHLKSGRAIDVIYDHIVHNILFPEAKYTLVGVSSILDEVRFVLAQPFYYCNDVPNQIQIEKALESRGLIKEDNYYYGNDYVSVTDVYSSSDNVIIDDNGKLIFIDPIIRMKKPIDDIINYYISFVRNDMVESVAPLSVWDKLKNLFLLHR